ncbi:MAG: porin family protein [Bacteroidales bacterium]
MKIKQTLILFAILNALCLNAQKFIGGVHFGVVTSQVDGDRLEGYNKPGIEAGIYVENTFKTFWTFSMGLNYIQKGSRKLLNPDIPGDRYYCLRLNYVEVPIMIGLSIKKKYITEAGIAVGYLYKAREDVDGTGFLDPYPPFKSYDIPIKFGLGYKINDHLQLKFHFAYSIIPIRNHPANQTWYFDRGQYNNYLILSLNLHL